MVGQELEKTFPRSHDLKNVVLKIMGNLQDVLDQFPDTHPCEKHGLVTILYLLKFVMILKN